MYIDKHAKSRYKALQQVAKSLREQSEQTLQTNIRSGKNDLLLRTRQIPPLKVTQILPSFEVGLYKDVFDYSNRVEDQIREQESEEDMHIISQNITEAKKRERSDESEQYTDSEDRKTIRKKSTSHPKKNSRKELSGTNEYSNNNTGDKPDGQLNSTPKTQAAMMRRNLLKP